MVREGVSVLTNSVWHTVVTDFGLPLEPYGLSSSFQGLNYMCRR